MNLSDATITQLLIPIDDFERGVAFYRESRADVCFSLRLLRWHSSSAEPFVCSWVSRPPGRRCKEARPIYFAGEGYSGRLFFSEYLRESNSRQPPHVVNRSAETETGLAEFVDPDENQLALISELSLSDA